MPDVSRRRLFGLLAGAAALPVLPALTKVSGFAPFTGAPQVMFCGDSFFAELQAVTRKAFVPKLTAQILKTNPLLARMMEQPK